MTDKNKNKELNQKNYELALEKIMNVCDLVMENCKPDYLSKKIVSEVFEIASTARMGGDWLTSNKHNKK